MPSESIFLQLTNKPQPTLTLMFMEVFSTIAGEEPDITLIDLITRTQERIGCVQDPEQIAHRLMQDSKQQEEARDKTKDTPPPRRKKGNGLGQSLEKWLHKLTLEQQCIVASDYDYDRARRLYCEVDKLAAERILSLKMESFWVSLTSRFESSLFAFGGKLKGGSGDKAAIEVDLTKPDSGGLAAMHAALSGRGF